MLEFDALRLGFSNNPETLLSNAKNAFFTVKSGKRRYEIETASFGFAYKRPTQKTIVHATSTQELYTIQNIWLIEFVFFSVGYSSLSQYIHIKAETKTYVSKNKTRNECLILGYDKLFHCIRKKTNAQIQYIVWPRNMHSIICITLKS